jgi:hypothetical protein
MALVQLVTILLKREQMRLLLRKQTWAFYLYVPLWKLSVNLKCWWALGSVCTPTGSQAEKKRLCALLLVDHFCSPSISFQLPSTNEIGVRKKFWDMGHIWQGSSTYLIMSHVLHHHHHLGDLKASEPYVFGFYIVQYKSLAFLPAFSFSHQLKAYALYQIP